MKISQRRFQVTLYAPALITPLLSCTVGCGRATQHHEAHFPALQPMATSAPAVVPPHPRADFPSIADIYPSEGEQPSSLLRLVPDTMFQVPGMVCQCSPA
jgi:hypothetical protein